MARRTTRIVGALLMVASAVLFSRAGYGPSRRPRVPRLGLRGRPMLAQRVRPARRRSRQRSEPQRHVVMSWAVDDAYALGL